MILSDNCIHTTALVFACIAHFGGCQQLSYKVKESEEQYDGNDYTRDPTARFSGAGASGGIHGSGFHFPDYFNDGKQETHTGFGTVSPFPSSLLSSSESRSGDGDYFNPDGPLKSRSSYDRGKFQGAPTRSVEYRGSAKSISELYDDWKPGDEQPSKWPSNDESDDISVPNKYSSPSSSYVPRTSEKYHSGNRPYSETSLKQHYKTVHPVGKLYGTNYGPNHADASSHQHKYGVDHRYDPQKSTGNQNYHHNLQNTKPQQFSNNYESTSHENVGTHNGYEGRSWNQYNPDGRNYDFFGDSTKFKPVRVKQGNDQNLHKSCVENNITTTINLSDGPITLRCYKCFDEKRPYERCIEVKANTNGMGSKLRRHKRNVNSASPKMNSTSRGKRQHEDDYYEDGEEGFGQEPSDYRFRPEQFTDDADYPSLHDDVDDEANPEYESEKCFKSKKGDMLCISCENRMTGGTYQQCSYASDPKKNSYERSVSKTYGSPRQPGESVRKVGSSAPLNSNKKKKPMTRSQLQSGSTIGSRMPDNFGILENGEPGSYLTTKDDYDFSSFPSLNTPASRGVQRSASRSNTPASTTSLRGKLESLNSHRTLPKRNPPPDNRAFSTPSPIGPNSFGYDIPDPYSPDSMSMLDIGDFSLESHGTRNRKDVDSSIDPGDDETFSSLFPELEDPQPTSAATLTPSYEEYPDKDHPDESEQRSHNREQRGARNNSADSMLPRPEQLIRGSKPPRANPTRSVDRKVPCKKIRKNRMICYQCTDENGTNDENCSYSATSTTPSRYSTYPKSDEMKNFDVKEQGSDGNVILNQRNENHRGKRKFKKFDPNEHNKYYEKESGGHQRDDHSNSFKRRNSERQAFNTTTNEFKRLPKRPFSNEGDSRQKRHGSEVGGIAKERVRNFYNPKPTGPSEPINLVATKASEGGRFTAETENKYDPILKFSLPKYIVEKSNHEAAFDEVYASSQK